MKFNFKNAVAPIIDIAAITGGAIASNQFLDFQKMMPNSDPNGFLIKHQGGIKAVAAGAAVGIFGKKMPSWAKMIVIGVGVAGAIKEIKALSNDKIIAIGAGEDSRGSDMTTLDNLLQQARQQSMNGGAESSVGANDAGAGVGATDAGAGVGYNAPDIPQMDYGTTVGWI